MSDNRALPDQSATDERTTMYAALAFGGFMDAEETERVTVWAAKRIEQLEAAIEDYILWEPGRRGHAEAHRKLCAALDQEDANA